MHGVENIFITSSFGYQSALLFFLLEKINIPVNCLHISSELSYGGVDEQKDYILSNFDVSLTEVDRSSWLAEELNGRDFFSLDEFVRQDLCSRLKREPLQEYINLNNSEVWISAIRKDQTKAREAASFIKVTDFGVTKVSPFLLWTINDVNRVLKENNLRINTEYLDLCKLNEAEECGLHLF